MDAERKFLIVFCGACILAFAGSLIAATACFVMASPWAFVCLVGAVIAWWWGSSTADVLRDERKKEGLDLLTEATDCERRARDYDTSDPYLAGVNSGRAEILRRWAANR